MHSSGFKKPEIPSSGLSLDAMLFLKSSPNRPIRMGPDGDGEGTVERERERERERESIKPVRPSHIA